MAYIICSIIVIFSSFILKNIYNYSNVTFMLFFITVIYSIIVLFFDLTAFEKIGKSYNVLPFFFYMPLFFIINYISVAIIGNLIGYSYILVNAQFLPSLLLLLYLIKNRIILILGEKND